MWSLIYNKRGKNMERNKDKSLIQMALGKTGYMQKKQNMKLDRFLRIYTRINSKWIKDSM